MDSKPRDTGHAVRLTDEDYRQLLSLQQKVVMHGWSVVGEQGTVQPTLAAVVGVAIAHLSDMATKPGEG